MRAILIKFARRNSVNFIAHSNTILISPFHGKGESYIKKKETSKLNSRYGHNLHYHAPLAARIH